MMKKVLFALLCSFCFYGAQAQEINCKVEKSAIVTDDAYRSTIISVDDDGAGGTVIARVQSTSMSEPFKDIISYNFDHYDSAMKLIKSYTYKITEKRGQLMGVIVKDGTIKFVDFRCRPAKNDYACTVYTAQINDLKFTKKELFTISKDEVKEQDEMFNSIVYEFGVMFVNADKTSFGISIDCYDKNVDIVQKIYLFDANTLAEKFVNTFKGYETKYFSISNFEISNDGNSIYLLGRARLVKKEKKLTGLTHQYRLTHITATGIKTCPIAGGADYPNLLRVVVKPDKIACIGLYSNKDKPAFATGICYYGVDPETLQITDAKLSPFGAQFLQDKFGDRKKDLRQVYEFRSVFLTQDNGLIFNAEEVSTTSYPSSYSGGFVSVYNYDDILSIKVDDYGAVLWERNFNKKEVKSFSNMSVSYTSVAIGDSVYFFFNAGGEPVKLDDTRIEFRQNVEFKSTFYVIRINKDGTVNYKPLLSYNDEDLFFAGALGSASKGDNTIYFTGGKEDKRQLLKISL